MTEDLFQRLGIDLAASGIETDPVETPSNYGDSLTYAPRHTSSAHMTRLLELSEQMDQLTRSCRGELTDDIFVIVDEVLERQSECPEAAHESITILWRHTAYCNNCHDRAIEQIPTD